MLSDKDIDKMIKVFATKHDVDELKEKMDTFENTQQRILSAVEGLASTKDKKIFEDAARDAQLSRHDGWIHQIADETKSKLRD